MAIARKCDRCGKLYEFYPLGHKSQCNGVQRIYITITGVMIAVNHAIYVQNV